ncbi:MFS transporter [Microterricola viridarii]|uniref:Predicted arabinose efflux permease, MFS family n=1 Tax=Microterricola viridarii TaxID=412690 RepID=A0A1H1QIT2_9MICO|nr:MFS transporter [Microterricola viridarii]SDS23431.1 Predicted arabinose efflux permease, MFS family [Microterricola viridarii]
MTETAPSRHAPPAFPWVGLLTLAVAVFLSITIEMLPMGLLPDMSAELGASEPEVGLLVSVFAFTVVLSSAPLMALTRRLPRQPLLVGVLVILALSAVLTAIAPSYEFIVATRVLGGAAHGLFWSIVGAYAGHLVPKEQLARAVAITTAGGSLAFVLGVPLGTALGHAFGWRVAFAGIAGLTLLGALLVWRLLPGVQHRHAPAAGAEHVSVRRDPTLVGVIVVCVVTGVVMIGQYAVYTYIAPYLIEVLGADAAAVGPLLFGYGIAGALGLLLAGTVLGRHPTRGLLIAFAGVGVGVAALALLSETPALAIAAFLFWGVAFGALPPMLNTRLLHTASARIRDAAAAFYTTAFNLGIGGGALLGAALYATLGLQALPWVFVGILALSFVLVLVTSRRPHVHPH